MYARIESTRDLARFDGERVELAGKISETPWQHMVSPSADFPNEYYFDAEGGQIVIYSKTLIECPGELVVRGTVVKIQGSSKRPDAVRDTKADETYVEYHVRVDEWVCR